MINKLKSLNPIIYDIKLFRIDSTKIYNKIINQCNMIINEIYKYIQNKIEEEFKSIYESASEIFNRLNKIEQKEERIRELEL